MVWDKATVGILSAENSTMQILRFATAKDYLEHMHPEYNFVFTIAQRALTTWSYDLLRAQQSEENMIRIACEHARQQDWLKGLDIVIEDGSCREREEPDHPTAGLQ